jgi:predicted O-linked N-acetylglucosamine transferase (SPINDLY family)
MATLSEALAIAVAHHRAGRWELAEETYRRILAVEPEHAEAMHLWGVLAHQAGEHAVAVERIRRAIALAPAVAAYHGNLGEVYRAMGANREAVGCYERALELDAGFANAHNGLGLARESLGQVHEAMACYRRALELNPRLAESHYNLGLAWHRLGSLDEAEACHRQAVELNPGFAAAWNNLGALLAEQGRLTEAISCYHRALGQNAGDLGARVNLGNALLGQGSVDEAMACYRQVLELDGSFATGRSNLLMGMQYRPGVNLAELAAAHAEYDRRHAAALLTAWPRGEKTPDPDRTLRLGFVSPDFGEHPVGHFVIRPLENLDRQKFEVLCYSDRGVADALTRRFMATATAWRDTNRLTHEELARQIRADSIDILFDLAGHTAGNRLAVFARKPAPIQITWAGYVGTTGLCAMDYLLADRHHVPPEAEAFYCEKVLRMPNGYVCFDAPAGAPPVGRLPALAEGCVTFGCFNNPAKIGPQVMRTWGAILRRVPRSRLLLKSRPFDSEAIRRDFAARLAAAAVDLARVEIAGGASRLELLDHYNRVDVALDPFPYSGGLTTCEALWMGVPVITCPGETFAGRHTYGHLSTVGLRETIAGRLDEYVELAATLADNLPRLAAMRAGLREQVARAPLCDGAGFAQDLAALLRDAWRTWCVADKGKSDGTSPRCGGAGL